MKKLILTLLLGAAISPVLKSQIPTPQVPLTGVAGSAGNFPFLNSGSFAMPSDADYTAVYPNTSCVVCKITSSVSLTATRNVIEPSQKMTFHITNATSGGQSIVVRAATGTGVTIANGTSSWVWFDGTNYVAINPPGSGGGATLPSNAMVFGLTPTTSRAAAFTDIVPLWASGGCSGFLKSDGTCSTGTSGGAAGSPTQVQFNTGAAFDATGGFTFDKTVNALATTGSVSTPDFYGTAANPPYFANAGAYVGHVFGDTDIRNAFNVYAGGVHGSLFPQVHNVRTAATFNGLGQLWRSTDPKGATTQVGRGFAYTSLTDGQSIMNTGTAVFLGSGDEISGERFFKFGGNGFQDNAEDAHLDWDFATSVPSGSGGSSTCTGGCGNLNDHAIIVGTAAGQQT